MARTTQRLIALALAAGLAFSYPLLGLFGGDGLVFGLPTQWIYLLLVWALVIGLAALVIETHPPPPSGNDRV